MLKEIDTMTVLKMPRVRTSASASVCKPGVILLGKSSPQLPQSSQSYTSES